MNKQLLRLKRRSDDTVLNIAECDDSDNLYVNVATGTINEVEKAVMYGIEKEHDTEMAVSLTDEGSVWVKDIQDSVTFEDSYMMTWVDSAPQFTGYEHVYTMPADYTYQKHMVYVANPSMDTALNLSVRNGVQMFGGQVYGQIYTAVVPASSYSPFLNVDWSSCFYSIGGVLTDRSTQIFNATSNDIDFYFAAVNDAIYFGNPTPFQRMRVKIGTAGNYNALGAWEYWNGAAWVQVPMLYDDSNATVKDGTQSFKRSGSRYIQWQIPSDWAAYDIAGNPTSQYWVRWRITNFTSRTTGPSLSQGWFKPVGKANVHGYLVEGAFNGENLKITLENATAVPALSGFPAEIYIRSV